MATLRVAIVDDEADIVRLHQRVLTMGGHEPVVVAPAEAMGWSGWSTIDAAIVDLYMPEVSGATILAMLAADHPKVRRILVTAAAERDRLDPTLAAQVRIAKPFLLDDLLAAVEPDPP
jgi:DNA-binding NtrC family response regulator